MQRGHLPAKGRGAYLWFGYSSAAAYKLRMPQTPAEYAAKLYGTLHELDTQGFDWIAVELPPAGTEWAAVRDRLLRASY